MAHSPRTILERLLRMRYLDQNVIYHEFSGGLAAQENVESVRTLNFKWSN